MPLGQDGQLSLTTDKLNQLAMNFDPTPILQMFSQNQGVQFPGMGAAAGSGNPGERAGAPMQAPPSFAGLMAPQGQGQAGMPMLSPQIMQMILGRTQSPGLPPAGIPGNAPMPQLPGFQFNTTPQGGGFAKLLGR